MHFPPPPPQPPVVSRPPSPFGRNISPPEWLRRWGPRVGLAVGLVTVLGAATFATARHFVPSGAVPPGLAIGGERVPTEAAEDTVRAFVAERAKALGAREIAFVMPGHDKPVLTATLEELGVRVDVDRTLAFALSLNKDGDFVTRAERVRDAREGRLDVPLYTWIDDQVAMAKLHALKEREDIAPVSARLDLEKHETVPEKDGHYIDAYDALAAIERASRDRTARTIALSVRPLAPRVSSAFLRSVDVSAVLAEYETYFSRNGDQRRRGRNIDNAAQKLDGIVISPGELFSFNEVIGERSEENGFEKSWEIFKGEMVEGVGGGTCQVASTFHAATFFSGFDVLERLPHSRPSAYIPMGLDSTVVYPGVDLKVRNPHPFPIVVHAKVVGNRLKVEMLGKARPVHVALAREILETIPFKRKIEEDPKLRGKKVVIKQHGIQGYKIKLTRLFTYPDGTKKKEEVEDSYPATTEIYKVPVGFDVALLPPLPGGDEDEDPDLGGNPSPAPAMAQTPSVGTDVTASFAAASSPASDIVIEDAPGAHAPTAAQRAPEKKVWLRR